MLAYLLAIEPRSFLESERLKARKNEVMSWDRERATVDG